MRRGQTKRAAKTCRLGVAEYAGTDGGNPRVREAA